MELQKQVVLFQPTSGPDPDGCPKCKAHMEPFDGADIKDTNYRGKLCPKCGWFVGVRSKVKQGGGRIDPRKYGQFEEKFEGRFHKKDRSRENY